MTERTLVMVISESPAVERMLYGLLHAAGCDPVLPGSDERALAAVRRVRPAAVLLDCEHPAAVSDLFFDFAGEHGIGVLVYGRDPLEADVEIMARQQNVGKLTLPSSRQRLADAVAGAMPPGWLTSP
ncbi:MAG: hypothetical protein H0X64_04205 [Gemmatimonadaceae bacterium]|nr:hypothetical protein [Gemmatimonadaceae bacterium]